MKMPNRTLSVAVALVLSAAGIGFVLAGEPAKGPAVDEGPGQVTETVSGAPSPAKAKEMSADGLAAARAIHLARMTLNDGYTEDARKLLLEAQRLLDKVKQINKPVMVATQVKMGEKDLKNDHQTLTQDLIPILSQIAVVETYDETPEKVAAVKQAKEHLGKGERAQAIEVLRLAQVGLVTHDVGLPLAETSAGVDQALKLIDAGKLHEANLALKGVTDGLVEDTKTLVEPPAPKVAQPAEATAEKAKQQEKK
jgi:hypothetical protein